MPMMTSCCLPSVFPSMFFLNRRQPPPPTICNDKNNCQLMVETEIQHPFTEMTLEAMNIIENTDGMIFVFWNNAHQLLSISPNVYKYLGYHEVELRNTCKYSYEISLTKGHYIRYHRDGTKAIVFERVSSGMLSSGNYFLLEKVVKEQLVSQSDSLHHLPVELQDFFENISIPLHVVGSDGVIRWANSAELRLMGYSYDEYIGENASVFHVDKKTIHEKFRRLGSGENLRDFPAKLRRKDGSVLSVRLYSSAVFDKSGHFLYSQCYTRDITTDELLIEAQIRESAAQECLKLKSTFLATVTHEMRTPLNGIIGISSLLLESQQQLSAEQIDHLETIESSAEILLSLINDILDLTRAESGKLIIEKIPFDALKLLDDVKKISQYSADSKGIPIEICIEIENIEYNCHEFLTVSSAMATVSDDSSSSNIDITDNINNNNVNNTQISNNNLLFNNTNTNNIIQVLSEIPLYTGDSFRIKQILLNYLSNAIKFTDNGQITIHLKITKAQNEADPDVIRFTVKDTGIGIEDVSKLFIPFIQADDSIARKYGGSGLGLSICKKLGDLMDGETGATSIPRVGSEFFVTLPCYPYRKADKKNEEVSTMTMIRFDISQLQIGPGLDSYSSSSSSSSSSRGTGMRNCAAFRKVSGSNRCHSVVSNSTTTTTTNTTATTIQKTRNAVKVLLAEDNKVNQKVAVNMLHRLGCIDVTVAENGAVALQLVKDSYQDIATSKYDIIFMDMQMPIMDGLEATEKIRQFYESDPLFKTSPTPATIIPIVALTANSTEHDRKMCLDSGMNDFLTKPMTLEKLRDCLNSWIIV